MQPISVMKINRISLSFPETLEKSYRSHYFNESVKLFRIAFVSLAIAFGLFGYLDVQMIPEHKNFLWLIRYGVVIPILLLVLVVSFASIFTKIWQWMLFAAYLISGTGIVAMLVKTAENGTYFAGLFLIFLVGYFFIKLRFLLATIGSWAILVIFNIAMLNYGKISTETLLATNLFFISANLISMVAAYYIEYFSRKSFFLTFQLERKKKELEQSNKNLEKEVAKRTSALAESEEKFRTVFNHSGIGIAILDYKGRLIDSNQALSDFLGYGKEELRAIGIEEATHPDDLEITKKLHSELIQGGRDKYETEKRYIHKSGITLWAQHTVSAITINQGEPPLIVAMITNINDYKIAQEELLRERTYFEYLFNTAPVGILLLNNRDIIVDCNNEFTRLFQFTKAKVKGKAVNELIVPSGLKAEATGVSQQVADGKTVYFESIRMRKDGQLIDVAITGKPVFVNSGQVAIYGIYQDISERKLNEEKLNRQLAFQENAVSVAARFASTLDLDKAINDSLKEIGLLCNADRSYLFFLKEDGRLLDNTHEWCAEGIEPQIDNLKDVESSSLSWWMKKLYNNENIIIEDVDLMPAEAEVEQKFLKAQDIRSTLALPVKTEGRLTGFIGFDFVSDVMHWSERDLAILNITAEVIGHAVERTRFRQALMHERDLLQALMDNIPDTIYFKDRQSRFTRINKAQAKVLGIDTIEDAIGKTDLDFFNHSHAQLAHDDEQKLFEEGTPIIGKLEYFKTNGKWCWMSATKVPIYNQASEIIGLVGVSHDMTEQKRVEEMLRSRERFLSHLNEITNLSLKTLNTPDLFQLLADQIHKLLSSDISFITIWNDETKTITPVAGSGIGFEQLKAIKFLTGEQSMTESVLTAEKVLVAEDVFNSPYISPEIAKQFPSKSLLGLPLIAYGKKLGAVLIGFRQMHVFTKEEIELGTLAAYQIALVVARTTMLEQLMANDIELRKLNAEKDKLFSVIAHDLRSPFTSFLGLTEMMTDESVDLSTDEMREFATEIQKSANSLYSLLENLLEWSRMQGGASEFSPEKLRLDEIVKTSLGLLNTSASRKSIDIAIDISEQILVQADHRMLRSLIGNLISNAIKFTKRGGKVLIKAIPHNGDWVLVDVTDTGIGMTRETLSTLFRIDVKVTSQGTEGEPSSGLGLILCKEFVEKHGGNIWVESEPGKGSSFYFTIPAAK